MRALVKREPGSVPRIEQWPAPLPGADEVLMAVRAVGICGTDLHILQDTYTHADPLIPGHEFAAEILSVGDAVEGWEPGERVVGELHVGACRVCETCRSGNPQICPSKRALGTWRNGAFAELLALPAWLLHRIPEGLPYPAATLIEPAACVWRALGERSHVDAGDRVLVLGHGPIGLLSAHVATLMGARQVILVGRSRRGNARLRCARALGYEVLDASIEDIRGAVAELTDGRGVDLAVETAGSAESLSTCLTCARRGGRVAVLGVSGRDSMPFAWDRALQHDLTIAFSFSSRASSWKAAIEMAATDALPHEALITHSFELDDWSAGFDAVHSGSAVKVVLTP